MSVEFFKTFINMSTFSIYCEESCTEKLVINYQDSEDISQIMNNLFLTDDNFDYVETDANQLTPMLKNEHQNLNNDFGSIDEYSSYFVPSEKEDAKNYNECVLDEYKKRLFVANFPYGTKLAELVTLFKQYGSLDESKCRLFYRKYHFNYAFIEFRQVADAQRAQRELNECLFNDSRLNLRVKSARYRDPIKMGIYID
jgi:RNA recognition motif-containing protein